MHESTTFEKHHAIDLDRGVRHDPVGVVFPLPDPHDKGPGHAFRLVEPTREGRPRMESDRKVFEVRGAAAEVEAEGGAERGRCLHGCQGAPPELPRYRLLETPSLPRRPEKPVEHGDASERVQFWTEGDLSTEE